MPFKPLPSFLLEIFKSLLIVRVRSHQGVVKYFIKYDHCDHETRHYKVLKQKLITVLNQMQLHPDESNRKSEIHFKIGETNNPVSPNVDNWMKTVSTNVIVNKKKIKKLYKILK